ncbi:MAG: hypothetical protein WC681_04035 [Sterolibacterium sp.]|jgi:hypothetical protein
MPPVTGSPNITLSAVVSQETTKALRAGMTLETVIATLIWHVETLQISLPIVNAVMDGKQSGS